MLRYVSIFLLLLLRLTALPEASDRSNPDVLKRFHDDTLNITYFYPSRFMAYRFLRAQPLPPARAMLSPHPIRQLHHPDHYPLFRPLYRRQYLSRLLAPGAQLGPFIREEILRQLKQYGQPSITEEPTRYKSMAMPQPSF